MTGLYFVGGCVLALAIYLTWLQLSKLRPAREKELVKALSTPEVILLERLAKSGQVRPIKRGILVGELRGTKDAERITDLALSRLIERGCIQRVKKDSFQATNRGSRVYRLLAAKVSRKPK